MKIISVLVYPYENRAVVKITRAESPFSFPQISHTYTMPWNAERAEHFFDLYFKLQNLHGRDIVKRMKKDYGTENR